MPLTPSFLTSWIPPNLQAYLLKTIYTSTTIFAVLIFLLYLKQDSLLYYPSIGDMPLSPRDNPEGYKNPGEMGMNFENVSIECIDGVRIHAWLILHRKSANESNNNRPTIVFFHGNAGNIGFRLPNALQMFKNGYNILQVEYRGYGDSDTGVKINETGLNLDAIGAWKWLGESGKVDMNKVFLFGRSLGGSVAFSLASYIQTNEATGVKLAGVIVENTFLSIPKMVDAIMPYVAPFKSLILTLQHNSELLVPNLTCPILYISGQSDELVPRNHMEGLFDLSLGSRLRRMYRVKGGMHNDTWMVGGLIYWVEFNRFVGDSLDSNNNGDKASSDVNNGVGNGVGEIHVNGDNGGGIPIMPGNVFDMAMAARGSSSKTVKKDN